MNGVAEKSLVDTYRDAAIAAGLSRVDGWNNRSIYFGETAAWRRVMKALRTLPESACVAKAIADVQWAIDECRAPGTDW